MSHIISNERLTLERLKQIIDNHEKLELSEASVGAIVKCREYLDRKTDEIDRPLY